MIVEIEKYRRFTLNQRPCAPTQHRPIFVQGMGRVENTLLSLFHPSPMEREQKPENLHVKLWSVAAVGHLLHWIATCAYLAFLLSWVLAFLPFYSVLRWHPFFSRKIWNKITCYRIQKQESRLSIIRRVILLERGASTFLLVIFHMMMIQVIPI